VTTGDDEAFDSLFLREFSRVRAIAVRTGLDPFEAEDVAQEVFAQFYGRHSPQAAYAAAWLRRAAAHFALNTIRSRRRRGIREERQATAIATLGVAGDASSDPLQAMEIEERRADIRRLMSRLPQRQAAVLAMRHSGMSYAEVAAAMQVPVGHVGSMLRRAEAAFKKEFDHATHR